MRRVVAATLAFECTVWTQAQPKDYCWSVQSESCCEEGSSDDQCFDSIYTRRECCNGNWAILTPEASIVKPRWDGLRESSSLLESEPRWPGPHPSRSSEQTRWERRMKLASSRVDVDIFGHRAAFYTFKRAVSQLMIDLFEVEKDTYRLQDAVSVAQAQDAPIIGIDVGAHIGSVAVAMCKLWGPRARVVAIEPSPSNFRYLLWNLRVNNVTDCVWPINIALVPRPTTKLQFWYSAYFPSMSRLCNASDDECSHVGNDEAGLGGWVGLNKAGLVATMTFDRLFRRLPTHAKSIAMLKVDCEGCELDLFKREVWDHLRLRVRHVVVEIHGSDQLWDSICKSFDNKISRPLCFM